MTEPILHCPDPARWLRRISESITQDGDCWRWTKYTDRQGYGRFSYCIAGVKYETSAHRASWLVHRSDIPVGLEPDHLCRIPGCVNPWHLELVTHAVNVARGDAGIRGCGKHGQSDGHLAFERGYLRWKCHLCRRKGRARGGKRGRPRKQPEDYACKEHGRKDGYLWTTSAGYTRWVCRICRQVAKPLRS